MTQPSSSTATASVSLHEQKQNATFRAQRLSAVPSDLLTMRNLVVLDLSYNRLTRLPGELLAQDMPRLEVLSLQHNLLYILEDVLALSVASRLRELNVSANPLRLVNNRIYFLEALFGAPGCDAKTLRTVHKDDTLTAQARSLPAASTAVTRPSNTSKRAKERNDATVSMLLVHKLPRRTGFPMLQKLNGQWITDEDVLAVENERGRAVEYYVPVGRTHAVHTSGFVSNDRSVAAASTTDLDSNQVPPGKGRRFDGSRMTAKELLKKTTRSAAIPNATVIHRFQIDVESNRSVVDGSCDPKDDQEPDDGDKCDENEVIRRLFARDNAASRASTSQRTETALANERTIQPTEPPLEAVIDNAPLVADDSSWNYPIRTFDELTSDDRQYIRHRSKQSVESNLQRDDHFFESSVFLDCVAQAERSRRLTLRAVDALCPLPQTSSTRMSGGILAASQSAPSLVDRPVSTAAAQLRETLAAKFSKTLDQKQYAKLESFLANPPAQLAGAVDDRDMQAALSEFFVSEHVGQHQRTRQLLAAHTDSTAPSAANSHPLETVSSQLDDSLSKTKLRNAVDLANALRLNKKQEKRMMQMLIDADARAIEQERSGLEQALHRHRLDLIASNQFYATPQAAHEADRAWMAQAAKHKTPSPWQARNWRAKDAEHHAIERQQRAEREAVATSNPIHADAEPSGPTQLDLVADSSPSSRRSRRSAGSKPPRAATSIQTTAKKAVRPASAAASASASVSATLKKPEAETKVATSPGTRQSAKFRSIETVEQAARDSLAHVNSHDLLVHCAAIHQGAEGHAASLAQFQDKFLEDEAAWEAMRQDPINIVRRHLRRKLYQDAQEVQIAGTQLFYSPLFQ